MDLYMWNWAWIGMRLVSEFCSEQARAPLCKSISEFTMAPAWSPYIWLHHQVALIVIPCTSLKTIAYYTLHKGWPPKQADPKFEMRNLYFYNGLENALVTFQRFQVYYINTITIIIRLTLAPLLLLVLILHYPLWDLSDCRFSIIFTIFFFFYQMFLFFHVEIMGYWLNMLTHF